MRVDKLTAQIFTQVYALFSFREFLKGVDSLTWSYIRPCLLLPAGIYQSLSCSYQW